jgi:hypothetical protein
MSGGPGSLFNVLFYISFLFLSPYHLTSTLFSTSTSTPIHSSGITSSHLVNTTSSLSTSSREEIITRRCPVYQVSLLPGSLSTLSREEIITRRPVYQVSLLPGSLFFQRRLVFSPGGPRATTVNFNFSSSSFLQFRHTSSISNFVTTCQLHRQSSSSSSPPPPFFFLFFSTSTPTQSLRSTVSPNRSFFLSNLSSSTHILSSESSHSFPWSPTLTSFLVTRQPHELTLARTSLDNASLVNGSPFPTWNVRRSRHMTQSFYTSHVRRSVVSSHRWTGT